MFTGLIEKISNVEKIEFHPSGAKISYFCDFENVKIGDSIAVNGVCLTVNQISGSIFSSDIMLETLKNTNLKNLKKGDEINLERALKISGRLDGHIVSGHVDNIAKVDKIIQEGFSKRIKILSSTDLVVNKGSIALNGVSLTVCGVFKDGFEVSLIPQTQDETNLKNLKIGDIVNIEYDIFAKYIQKFLNQDKKTGLTLEFLKENGF